MPFAGPRYPRGGMHPHNPARFQHMPQRPIRMPGGHRPPSHSRGRHPFPPQRGIGPNSGYNQKQKPTVPVKPTVSEPKNTSTDIKPSIAAPSVSSPMKPQPSQTTSTPNAPKVKSENTPILNQPPQNRFNYQGQSRQNNYANNEKNLGHNNNFRKNKNHNQSFETNNAGGNKPFYGVDKIKERVTALSGPQFDLPTMDMSEKKFNCFSRLFVGNFPKNTSEEDLQNLFGAFGEMTLFLSKDNAYAFVNFDYRANALKALREVNNTVLKGRYLKVRFAAISEGIRVKNLSSTISNEILERAFSAFGQVDSARVIVDDRGVTKGEGIVIFKEKKTAYIAVKKCQDECFVISGTARPVIVSALESTDDNEDGLAETSLPRNEEYQVERRHGPHFVEHDTFEHEFGLEWKKLFEVTEEKRKNVEEEFRFEVQRLEKRMVIARVEFEKDKLRRELAVREAESAHLRRRFGSGRPAPFEEGYYDNYPPPKRPIEDNFGAMPYDAPSFEPYERRGPGHEYEFERPAPFQREAFEGRFDGPRQPLPDRRPPPFERPDMYGPAFDRHEEFPAPKRARY